jgi:peptide-methionine (S)-S-oxide reductase
MGERRKSTKKPRLAVTVVTRADLHARALNCMRGADRDQPGRRRISIVMSTEKATFGAGCFWGVEAAFAAIPGVTATAVGYEGGTLDRPTYRDVCGDQTGHAEVVELDFDPGKIGYEALLDKFFSLHDPTTMNRQGPDWGTQYRSVIFYHSPEQESAARAKIEQLTADGRYKPKRIVTQVVPAQTFWRAEEYHQRYLEKRGQASCHI